MKNPTHSIDELYAPALLALAASASHVGRLQAYDGAASRKARVCGSIVRVELQVDADGRVAKFAHEVQACAIGQAAAALVAASVIESDLVSIEAGMNGFAEYLRGSRSRCDSWPGLSVLALVREYPMRHGAALLAFEAVIEALRKVLDERRRGAVAGGGEQVSARPSA